MPFNTRPRFTWRLRTRTLPLGRRTLLMGILNVTPDSFSDGNRFFTPLAALNQALKLLDQGADLVDLGGESTRTNSQPVSVEEEQERILPVLEAILKSHPDSIISVDTYHAETAERALQAGAEDHQRCLRPPLGSRNGGRARRASARRRPHAHPRRTPHVELAPTLAPRRYPSHGRLRPGSYAFTRAHCRHPRATIVLDPGFGFGKRGDENFTLLAHLAELQQFALPILVGISRKRFLTEHLTEATETSRLETTTAANVAAILAGAHILRVHDIPAARAAASVADAILNASQPDDNEPHPSGVRKTAAS